jgi:type IV pilus assembly protein PilB
VTQPPQSPSPPKTLGQQLVGAGLLSSADLDRALALKRQQGSRLGQALIELGLVSSLQVAEALREQGKLACITLTPEIIDKRVALKLGEESSRSLRALAINEIAGVTTVVMEDPADVYVLDELSRTLRTKVMSVYCEAAAIEASIDEIFAAGAQVATEQALDDIASLARESDIDLEGGSQIADALEEDTDIDGPVVSIIQAILKEAFEAQASDIHLEPRESTFVVRFRVDGSLYERMTLKKAWARPCISRIKVLSNLDIAQRRLPQDGRTQITVQNRRVDLRVSTMPTLLGEGAVIRILDGGRGVQNLAKLGLREEQERTLREMTQASDGIVLAVGPTGSGKTTTLYALLQEINDADTKIITLEDPVENLIESICQINCDVKAGLTFSRGLRSILRQDPDVILVGEIRDAETAEISVSAALTGHMVLSTLHTIGAAETITRMKEMGVEHFLLADTLRGICAQRLLRLICPICRELDVVDDDVRRALGLEPELDLYRGTGCSECNDTGYKGRRGIFELLAITPALSDALRCNANVSQIRELARESGMRTLREEALLLVRNGQTTVAEALSNTPSSVLS